MLQWVAIEKDYLDYLRNNYDPRIPKGDYGEYFLKPFFGVLFETEEFVYITQVSHPQPRHYSLKNSVDFIKVFDEKRLLCVVNLNYMFPIPKSKVVAMKYENIDEYRLFHDDKEKNDYIALLKLEMKIINTLGLESKAKKVYQYCNEQIDMKLVQRSLDFKRIEEGCRSYYSDLYPTVKDTCDIIVEDIGVKKEC